MDNLDLKEFNGACEEFVSGKYILAGIKVKALINAVHSSEKLTNLVSSCLDGFDFNEAFRNSVTPSGIVPPADNKSLIGYCFNILYNIDVGTVAFLDLLSKYFTFANKEAGDEFKLFASTIIEPFKKAINEEYINTYEMTSSVDYKNNIYHKLSGVCEANIKEIDELRLKEIEEEELIYLLTAMIDACERNDKKAVYALMVGIDYFVKCNKRARNIFLQLKDCFERI